MNKIVKHKIVLVVKTLEFERFQQLSKGMSKKLAH